MIPFGEWRPDLPDFQNPGATEAKNVIPDINSYRPFPDAAAAATATGQPDDIVGGAFYSETPPTLTTAGTGYVYCGTEAKLFRNTLSGSWEDVSRTTGGAYTSDYWHFEKFGTRVIAVNGADVPQSFVEGTSTDFAALAGSPPATARYISVVRDFVNMAPIGNVQHWCAINDPTDWTPSATTQADSQTIPDGGIITALAGGEYGVTFMQSAIYRQTYIGSPLIFQFDKITEFLGIPTRGISSQYGKSYGQYENMIFFYSGESFNVLVGEQEIIPIGQNKVDKFFRDESAIFEGCCVDPFRKLFVVLYSTASFNNLLMYHWPTQRWSRAEILALS